MLTSNIYNKVRPYNFNNNQNLKQFSADLSHTNPSFGLNPLMKKAVNGLEELEKRPALAFVLMDSLGMVIPRTIIDLNRNKEELGHLNWHAGRETLLSEIWSDAMLFFMPGIGFTVLGNSMLNSKYNQLGINTTAFTNFKNLNMLETKLREILQTSVEQKLDINILRQKLARTVLENVFAASAENPHGIDPKLIDKVVTEIGSSMHRANVDQLLLEDKTFQRILESNPAIKQEIDSTIETLSKASENLGLSAEEIKLRAIRSVAGKRINEVRKFSGELKKYLIQSRDLMNKNFIKGIAPLIRESLKEDEIVVSLEKVANQGAEKMSGVTKTLLGKTTKVGSDVEKLLQDIFYGTDDLIIKAANGSSEMEKGKFLESINETIKQTKRFKSLKVVIPLTISTLGLVLFPGFNMWLTRKLNGGKNEFPGVSGLIKNRDTDNAAVSRDAHEVKNNISITNTFNASGSDTFRKSSIFDQIEGRI